ncbi:MAG: ABC transporter substrate-binding protein, partial [Clostridia bacterium]|nr:ABC transporter substrate-binding protein [Clostridia bacterium]
MRKVVKVLAMVLTVAVFMAALVGCSNTPKVGVIQFADHPSLDNCREGFIEGLASMGYIDGENIEIVTKSAQADINVSTQIAQSFATSNTKLVCGIATPAAQSAYAACAEKNIPVVFNAVSDPVAAKLAVSDTEPAKNISGISDKLPVEDQLKLIRKVLPEAKKIGILYTTSEANSVSTIEEYKKLAPKYGFEIVEKGIGKAAEIPQAADVLLTQVDCISNMTDNTVVSALAVILEKANALKIPVFGSEEEQVKNGCIASAGLDYI